MASEPSLLSHSIEKSTINDIRRAVCPVSAALVILVAIAITGYFTYILTYDLQVSDFENKYSSAVAGGAVVFLRKGLDDNIRSARAMSAVIGSAFPTVDVWPFVYLYDFHTITLTLNRGLSVNFAPFVRPDEAAEFESFAYRFYSATYQEKVARSSFGEGIFAPVNTSCFTCQRYHDISGNTTYGSPNRILVPILLGNASVLMFNLHSSPLRGRAVDAVISCTNNATTGVEMSSCGAITIPTYSYLDPTLLTSIVYFPVFPIKNSTSLTGITVVGLRWNEILKRLFPLYVSQVHCVFRADDMVFTFVIEHGQVAELCEGDVHQAEMTKYGKVASVTSRSNLQSAVSTYTLTVYPTRRFREDYVNTDSYYVMLIVVVVLLTLFIAAVCGLHFYRARRRAAKTATMSKAKCAWQ